MATFEQFRDTFPKDSNDKGAKFEKFLCEWFLKTHPNYKNEFTKVWHFTEWPDRWYTKDIGTDLIAEDVHGKICAIQAKFYHPSRSIPTTEIDSFLSDSNRKIVDYRLLIGTTDDYSANAENKLQGQEKPVQTFLLESFLKWDIDWPNSLDELNSYTPPDLKTPRPHQRDAIDDVKNRLDTRGQLIMACGTGKTMTGLWIAEELEASTTLVLLPSLLLLSGTMFEWKANSKTDFHCLPVCSDESVTKGKGKDSDQINLSTSDLCVRPTTDVEEIATFLNSPVRKVIFSTYQSSAKIAEAFSLYKLSPFDLIIADEAHRCAGKADSAYSIVLKNELIPSSRRLFMTATPRIYSSSFKKRTAESGVAVVSMDDAQIFGPVLHKLSFGKAIEKNLLTDYQVVIVGIDNPNYSEMITERAFIKTDTDIESDAQSFASHIALVKAVKQYDLRRMISFHSRVPAAQDFALSLPEVISWMPDKSKPEGDLITDYVSGEMPTNQRNKKLQALSNISEGQRYILSNARCLSEGIDVPTLDGVAFIDPRDSEIDIIQAVGRAIRRADEKNIGSIVIPVFIEDHEDPSDVLYLSPFKKIWSVLNALRAHDEEGLGEELDQLRQSLGKRGTVGRPDKIVLDLPTTVTHKFEEALMTRILEASTDSWEFFYGLLCKYAEDFDNVNVHNLFRTPEGHKLGQWVSMQRTKYKIMNGEESSFRLNPLTLDQVKRLELLGFSFSALDARWMYAFGLLKKYFDHHGHSNVPHKTWIKEEDDFPLGSWVRTQRGQQDKLTPERRKHLSSVNFIYDPFDAKWQFKYSQFIAFLNDNNGKYPLYVKVSKGGDPATNSLAQWVYHQKEKYSDGSLDETYIKLLNHINFDFEIHSQKKKNLHKYFEMLDKFKAIHKHCNVPPTYKDPDSGFGLGYWMNKQIKHLENGELDEDFAEKLREIGLAD